MQSYIYTNNIIVIITFALMCAVRGNAPNLLAGCNGDQLPPLRILLSLVHFAGLFCPLRSRVIYLFIRQEHVAMVPAKFRPDWPPSLLLSRDSLRTRLIRQAEMRQQVLKYETYTIKSGLFHHLQHQSPPATFPSISNSHNHNHTSIYLLVSVL